ncbi:MAG TPA: hypothetical protein VE753_03965 [Gaiellaceae bacterium]|nr:hypothetical protein [Gaiellaceae bacterium]
MRARLGWLAGAAAVAGAVAYRKLRGGGAATAEDPRAAELRQRLDESRAIVEEREEFESAETPVDAAGEAAPEARRRVVHERGRAAAEEMRSGSGE